MKNWWGIPYGIVIGLLVAGIIILTTGMPRGKPIELSPPPSPSPLIVSVSGAVINPGVYSLPFNSRMSDAIQAAGGFAANANIQNINLAAKLYDEQMIQIPANETVPIPAITNESLSASSRQLVDINTGSQEELESLPGIDLELANRIINFRSINGPYKSIEDLLKIYGLTKEIYEQIKNLITVGDIP